MSRGEVLQPQYFEHFHCTGADCEDTCCDGWGINIDRETYEKYQAPGLLTIAGKKLSSLVEINPAGSSATDFAKLRLAGTRCPALSEGLCAIQLTLGEPYLSETCSSYPRVRTVANGVLEQSLQLSCPESARLVLTDPGALTFREGATGEPSHPLRSLSVIDDLPAGVREVRRLMIQVIRERSRPLWQRIASLGFALDELVHAPVPSVAILEEHLARLGRGAFDGVLCSQAVAPAAQLEAVMELVVARIDAEYVSPRFLECYRDFMEGLGWCGESTMDELASRYRHAWERHYLPFVRAHEHLFENYLINYMFGTFFPYGRKLPDTTLTADLGPASIRNAYLLLAAHYAIIRTLLIGMAGLHRHNLSLDHAVKLVQTATRAFQHSDSFSTVVLQALAPYANDPTRGVALLVMD